MEWLPQRGEGDFYRWDLPASGWSGADPSEDSIRILHEDGEWTGFTEVDQCVQRDLDDAEIDEIRREFGLDRYVQQLPSRPSSP